MAWRGDYHVHLERGPYSQAWVETFAATARQRGLQEVGFSEHLHDFFEGQAVYGPWWETELDPIDRAYTQQWWRGRPRATLAEFTSLVRAACPSDVVLRLGIEADYIPGCAGPLGHLLAAYPWDFVLGSIHWVGGWGFDHLDRLERWEGRDVDAVYRQYFSLVEQAARSGLFDVMAHVDVIKLAGQRPFFDLLPLYERLAQTFAKAGVAVEVSTAGLRRPVQEMYPAEAFLRCCRDYDVPITLASDAHEPELVGAEIEQAVALARRCGYTHTSRFVQRRREDVQL